MAIELTTVADDLAVLHDGTITHRHEGLAPATEHELHGLLVRTLPRPPGELLARVATVNDVHFGEIECGKLHGHDEGPIQRREPGEEPYPELMNRAAAAEIAAVAPDAVIAKGDLTTVGDDAEFAAFEACYRTVFGDRLHSVRGNHDAEAGGDRYSGDRWIEVPGLTIGLLDTVRPTETPGRLTDRQLAELDERLGATPGPVLILGHHQQYVDGPYDDAHRSPDYFGLDPVASDALDELCVRHRHVIGYAAGHTHRHRVRPMSRSGVPSIEIGCVKDFPGTWAEYRVYEGGVMQVVHRVSDPEALAWSDRCRVLYSDFGIDYETYALGSLAERCFVFPDRAGA
jgi:Icc protein